MTSIWRYVVDSLDDFVLFAGEHPLSAMIIVYLVLALAFAHLWARWITRLQQDVLPNLRYQVNATSPGSKFFNTSTNCFNVGSDFNCELSCNTHKGTMTTNDAIQGTNAPVRKLPARSSGTVTQPSSVGLGLFNKWPERNRPGLSSIASSVSNRSQRDQYAPTRSTKERYIPNTRNFHGWTVASPPAPYSSYVSFYASSNPSQRGELTLPNFLAYVGHIDTDMTY